MHGGVHELRAALENIPDAEPDHLRTLSGQPRGGEEARALRLRSAKLAQSIKERDELHRRFDPRPPPPPALHHERELQLSSPAPPEPPPSPAMPPPAEWVEDREALQELYETAGGSGWHNRANWLDGFPCQPPVWQGVVCAVFPTPWWQTPPSPPTAPPVPPSAPGDRPPRLSEDPGYDRVHRLLSLIHI